MQDGTQTTTASSDVSRTRHLASPQGLCRLQPPSIRQQMTLKIQFKLKLIWSQGQVRRLVLGPAASPQGNIQASGGSPKQLLRGALLLTNGAFGLWEVDVARNELRLVQSPVFTKLLEVLQRLSIFERRGCTIIGLQKACCLPMGPLGCGAVQVADIELRLLNHL